METQLDPSPVANSLPDFTMDMNTAAESLLEADYLLEVSTRAAIWARRMLLVEDVDDFASDVMLDCLAELRAGKPMVEPKARNQFVRRMVKHRIIDDLRAEERRDWREMEYARELDLEEHLWMSPDLALDAGELQHVIALAIDAMPALRRSVYLLAANDDFTHATIAALLQMTVRAVRGHIDRAQAQLRQVLTAYFDLPNVVPLTSEPPAGPSRSEQAA